MGADLPDQVVKVLAFLIMVDNGITQQLLTNNAAGLLIVANG